MRPAVDASTNRRYPLPVYGRLGRPFAIRHEVITIARIDDLIGKVDSKFTLVHLAAKRAREINSYYAQLGEGLGQHVPPLLSTESNKPLSIGLEEIAHGKVEAAWPEETPQVTDPLAFIDEGALEDEA